MQKSAEEGSAAEAAGASREWHYHPDLPIPTSPVFTWPPRPLAALKWLAGYWLALSAVAVEFLLAWVVLFWFHPVAGAVGPLALAGWIWLRNLTLMVAVAGGLHLLLLSLGWQGTALKYDRRTMIRENRKFTFRDQVRDNMFWTLASGVTVWTAYEVLVFTSARAGFAPVLGWADSPAWFVLWFVLIPIWASMHFYWIHRWLHWPPLYRLAHSVHHRNVNVGPWTGISMHPVEHLLYFSSLLIHLVVPSHPVHVLFHAYVMALNPAVSHSGFDGLLVRDRKRMQLGDFFHQLHHRYFECNYGTAEMPWDRWFGTFHNGTTNATRHMRERKRRIHGG